MALNLAIKTTNPYLKWARRIALILAEIFVGLLVLCLIGMAVFLARVHKAPLSLDFATDYAAPYLDEYNLNADDVFIHWPDIKKPILIYTRNFTLKTQNGDNFLTVETIGAGLSLQTLFQKKPVINALYLDKPSIILKPGNNNVSFSLDPVLKTLFDRTTTIGQVKYIEIKDGYLTREDLELSALYLKANKNKNDLRVNLKFKAFDNTRITGAIHATHTSQILETNWSVLNLNPDDLSSFLPESEAQPLPEFEGSINIIVPRFDVDTALKPQVIDLSLNAHKGRVKVPDYYPAYFDFDGIELLAHYEAESGAFKINDASVNAYDTKMIANVDGIYRPDQFQAHVKVNAPTLTHAQVKALYPANKYDAASYRWLVTKTTDYTFQDFQTSFSLVRNDTDTSLQDARITANFTGADIDYNPPMMPVENAAGAVLYDDANNALVIDVKQGTVGGLSLNDARVTLTDLKDKKKAKSNVALSLSGPMSSIFTYLARKPIGFAAPFNIDAVKGNGDFDIALQMPLFRDLNIRDIQTKADGTITNLSIPRALNNITLNADVLKATLNKHVFQFEGKTMLNNTPADMTYVEHTVSDADTPFKRKITVNTMMNQDLRADLGIRLDEMITGILPVDATYTDFGNDQATIDFQANLTPLQVRMDSIQYFKPSGLEGTMTAQGKMSQNKLQNLSLRSVTMPNFIVNGGTLSFINGKDMISADLPSVIYKGARMAVNFDRQNPQADSVQIKADQFDLRPYREEKTDARKPLNKPLQVFIETPALQTAEGQTLNNAKLYAVLDRQKSLSQLELDGKTGNNVVYLRYKPDETGRRVFKMQADDAGAALRLFDTYQNVRGGVLAVTGYETKPGTHMIDGQIQMTDFRVVKAASLAKLLGAMSLSGLTDLVNNDGLMFERLETDFVWQKIDGGRVIHFKNGHTVGNSLGLTFEGSVNTLSELIDISGTLVPLSGINKMMSDIPLVGDILSGGSDSIFAATYTIKGNIKSPRVVVNPLAALTPGILRQILFE